MVQPAGETMQVPAATAVTETPEVPTNGGAYPRQLTSGTLVGFPSATSTPFVPLATIFASSTGVSHDGFGSGSVVAVSAAAPSAPTSASAAASPTSLTSFRICPP